MSLERAARMMSRMRRITAEGNRGRLGFACHDPGGLLSQNKTKPFGRGAVLPTYGLGCGTGACAGVAAGVAAELGSPSFSLRRVVVFVVLVVAARVFVGELPAVAVEDDSVAVVQDAADAEYFRVPLGSIRSQGCRGVVCVGSDIVRWNRLGQGGRVVLADDGVEGEAAVVGGEGLVVYASVVVVGVVPVVESFVEGCGRKVQSESEEEKGESVEEEEDEDGDDVSEGGSGVGGGGGGEGDAADPLDMIPVVRNVLSPWFPCECMQICRRLLLEGLLEGWMFVCAMVGVLVCVCLWQWQWQWK